MWQEFNRSPYVKEHKIIHHPGEVGRAGERRGGSLFSLSEGSSGRGRPGWREEGGVTGLTVRRWEREEDRCHTCSLWDQAGGEYAGAMLGGNCQRRG